MSRKSIAPSLLLLFNHEPTPVQLVDAVQSLGVLVVKRPPEDIRLLWCSVPPDLSGIREYLRPVSRWIFTTGSPGDFVLIQGDFGATWLMVHYTKKKGMIPVYSTTERITTEKMKEDGTVKLYHEFKHVRFRRYGK